MPERSNAAARQSGCVSAQCARRLGALMPWLVLAFCPTVAVGQGAVGAASEPLAAAGELPLAGFEDYRSPVGTLVDGTLKVVLRARESAWYPWGDDEPTADRGAFDFSGWDPHPAGSHPAGRSAWGIDDLVGNGWEWTNTVFAPFTGFKPMPSYPEYSADFFDGEHFVMKGASPVTARELLRPTFRNWFRARYPYVYATFRCARDAR